MAPPTPSAPQSAAPRLPVPTTAAALLHAAPPAVEEALGQPDLRRADGGAQVWLYAPAPNCRVDVVFYSEAGEPRVAHAAARVVRPMREDACLKLVAGRPSP